MILLSLILCSCASIPDVPICTEINPDKAHCTYTLSPSKYDFTVDETHKFEKKTWWEIRNEMVLVPPSSWAKIKKFVIKQCKISGKCRKDVGQWMDSVEKKSDT